MKKTLATICLALLLPTTALAAFAPLSVPAGGTGSTTLTGILKGNLTGMIQSAIAGIDFQAPLTFPLSIANGGTATSTFYNGGTIFYDSVLGSLSQGNAIADFFFDKTNARLGLGTASPTVHLDVEGSGDQIKIGDNGNNIASNLIMTRNGTTRGGLSTNSSVFGMFSGSSIASSYTNGVALTGGTSYVSVGISTSSPSGRIALQGAPGGTANLISISSSTSAFATSSVIMADSGGNLSVLNGANLTVSMLGNAVRPNIALGPTASNGVGLSAVAGTTLGLHAGGTTLQYNGNQLFPSTDAARSLGIATTNRYLGVFTVNASTTNLTVSGISGSTQCLQADTNGNVTGTGSACGSGSGGTGNVATSSSETTGRIPFWTSTAATPATLSGGTAALFWDSANGRLGIGTSSPTSLVNLAASDAGTTLTAASAAMLDITNTNSTDNNFSDLAYSQKDSSGNTVVDSKIVGVHTDHTTSATSGAVAFFTRNAGTISEKMRILANGRVGIGVVAPSNPLDVLGFINTDANSGYKIGNTLAMYATTTANFFAGLNAGQMLYSDQRSNNTAIGTNAMQNASSSSVGQTNDNTAVGAGALQNTMGIKNVAIGSNALNKDYTGSSNTAIGYNALAANITGGTMVAIGADSLKNVNGTNDIIAIGNGALTALTSGAGNLAIGYQTNAQNVTALDNTSVGASANRYTTGGNNTAFGSSAGMGVSGAGATTFTTGAFFGNNAGAGLTTGNANTYIGYRSGTVATTGGKNLCVGNNSCAQLTTGGSNLGIGYNVNFVDNTGSEQMNIGSSIFGVLVTSDSSTADADSRIGVGSTTPFGRLVVQNVANVPSFVVEDQALEDTPFLIDASGNVGIGTYSPVAVNANSRLTVAGIGSQDIIASTTDNTTSSDAIIQAYAPGSRIFMGAHGTNQVTTRYGITLGGWGEIGAFNSSFGTTNGLIIGTNPAVPVVFGTNNLERARIDSAGNFGVGTTTPGSIFSVGVTNGINLVSGASTTATSTFSGNIAVFGTLQIGTGSNYLRDFATSTFAKAIQAPCFTTDGTTCITGGGSSYTATYPVTLTGSAFGLAFGTSSSNTWGGTQTFTNPVVISNFAGLISGNAGTTYATATSTATCTSASGISCTSFPIAGPGGTTIALSAIPNASLANSTISGIALGSNLANLTATNSTLTFSATYNGSAATTIGLNLGNANTWTGLQTFSNTGTTTFSGGIQAGTLIAAPYFHATNTAATSTFAGGISVGSLQGVVHAVAGALVTGLVNLATEVSGILGVANGGLGISTVPADGYIPVGNGTIYATFPAYLTATSTAIQLNGGTASTTIYQATIPANTLSTHNAVKVRIMMDGDSGALGGGMSIANTKTKTLDVGYGNASTTMVITNSSASGFGTSPGYIDIVLQGYGATNAQRLSIAARFEDPITAVTSGEVIFRSTVSATAIDSTVAQTLTFIVSQNQLTDSFGTTGISTTEVIRQ